jgi:hypothetical protein
VEICHARGRHQHRDAFGFPLGHRGGGILHAARALRRLWLERVSQSATRAVVLHDADAGGLGIGDIDELTHAVGVDLGGTPLGDLDRAPSPMRVEHDEQVDGAVAAVLVIVTLKLTRLGRWWSQGESISIENTSVFDVAGLAPRATPRGSTGS